MQASFRLTAQQKMADLLKRVLLAELAQHLTEQNLLAKR